MSERSWTSLASLGTSWTGAALAALVAGCGGSLPEVPRVTDESFRASTEAAAARSAVEVAGRLAAVHARDRRAVEQVLGAARGLPGVDEGLVAPVAERARTAWKDQVKREKQRVDQGLKQALARLDEALDPERRSRAWRGVFEALDGLPAAFAESEEGQDLARQAQTLRARRDVEGVAAAAQSAAEAAMREYEFEVAMGALSVVDLLPEFAGTPQAEALVALRQEVATRRDSVLAECGGKLPAWETLVNENTGGILSNWQSVGGDEEWWTLEGKVIKGRHAGSAGQAGYAPDGESWQDYIVRFDFVRKAGTVEVGTRHNERGGKLTWPHFKLYDRAFEVGRKYTVTVYVIGASVRAVCREAGYEYGGAVDAETGPFCFFLHPGAEAEFSNVRARVLRRAAVAEGEGVELGGVETPGEGEEKPPKPEEGEGEGGDDGGDDF